MNKEYMSISDQLHFFLSLINKDINHYQKQQDMITEWVVSSIQSLNETELDLLEELHDEYHAKISMQHEIMREFHSTLLKTNGAQLKRVSEC